MVNIILDKKSHTLMDVLDQFPVLPERLIAHFVRGMRTLVLRDIYVDE